MCKLFTLLMIHIYSSPELVTFYILNKNKYLTNTSKSLLISEKYLFQDPKESKTPKNAFLVLFYVLKVSNMNPK